jgi:pimeloyl-ACP methyl ester carboxylesterase
MKIDLLDTEVGGFNYEFLRAISYQASGGAELGECIAAVARIHEGDFDSWIQEWTRLADRVAQEAETALKKGKQAEACHAFLRASNYYRAAEFYVSHTDPRQFALWTRSRECFHQAASLMSPVVEILEIPFEEARLPGYFVSGGEGRRPTLIAMGGFDSSGEEVFHWIGHAAAERGWHCLIFEGPGQRGALHLNPELILRPDYEIPVSAVVDYALARPEIDHERLALIGYSLGGYLAPRATAFEPRIKACIANSLVVDLDEAWRASWPAPLRTAPDAFFDTIFATLSLANPHIRWGMDHARWSMGIKHPHEFFSAWKPYTLWGLEQRLQCPLLCLFGEDELAAVNQKLLEETVRYIDALKCLKEFQLFTRESGAASHCQMGGISRAQTVIFDWLEETFSREVPAPGEDTLPATRIPTELLPLIEKYHGKEIVRDLQGLDLFHNQRGGTDE